MNSDPSDRLSGLSEEQRRRLHQRVEQARATAFQGREASQTFIQARQWTGDRPLSPAQAGLYFMHQLSEGSPAFNRPLALRLRGRLDRKSLRVALERVVDRHTILRCTYLRSGDDLVCRLWSDAPLEIGVDDLSALPVDAVEAEARRRLEQHSQVRFELAVAPPLRLGLLRLADDDHILWLVVHHIAFDAWSAGIFTTELAAAYAVESGEPLAPVLPALPFQYADYAAWQLSRLAGPRLQNDLAYWQAQLSGWQDDLDLRLSGKQDSLVYTEQGARQVFMLSEDHSADLRRVAAAEESTPFMVLLALYLHLLGETAQSQDVAVGVPVAGRSQPGIDRLIGLFVNMLVFRANLSTRSNFSSLLQQVRSTAAGAFAHAEAPFERVVHALQPPRIPGRSPLIQAVFNYRHVPAANLAASQLAFEPFEFEPGMAQYLLDLEFTPGPQGLRGALIYNTQVFDDGWARRLVESYQEQLDAILNGSASFIVHTPRDFTVASSSMPSVPLQTLLESITSEPDGSVERLGLPPEEQRRQLLIGWNRTESHYPRHASLVGLFTEQVRTLPDAPALIFGAVRMTYAELDAASNRLARRLRHLGVVRETLVGLSIERSAGMVIAILGILKAGGAYLPLDPGYPAERLDYMVEDSGVQVVVTSNRFSINLQDRNGVRIVAVDSAEVQTENPAPIEAAGGPLDLAYVMYTSGSTGRPKGIAIQQRGVARLVKGSDYLQVRPGERVAQVSNISFDAATFEVWSALLNGGVLVGIEADVLFSPPALAEALRQLGIDHILVTTALFHQIAAVRPDAFNGLQTVLFGGEAVIPHWVRVVLDAGGPKRLINAYGPTECTTIATWQQIDIVPEGALSLPIGRPMTNTTAYVLNEMLQPAAVGVPGELYLGGDGLARGYWRRPELTAEKFVPNPVQSPKSKAEEGTLDLGLWTSDARLYATGDRVRRLADGSLEFLGRIDRQVKLRGYRIELEEIEAALSEHPHVEAAAVALVGEGDEKRLVGYVVWKGEEAGQEQQLRDLLRRSLPEYMLPAQWISLPELPLTANRKLDRDRLPAPPRTPRAHPRGLETGLQQALAVLWAEALGVENVGAEDNFFDLGGHSLLAFRLMARIQELFQIETPVRLIYAAPDLAGFATKLQAACSHDLEPVARLVLRLSELPDEAVAALLMQNSATKDGS